VAGYSGTPLPQKLGIKAGGRLGLVKAPADFASTLGALPTGVAPTDAARGKGPFDVLVCFVLTPAELAAAFTRIGKLDPAGGLWIAWPKKSARRTAGIATLVDERAVRAAGLAAGLVDNKVCAVDEIWSGLRFVVRLADRSRPASAGAAGAAGRTPRLPGARAAVLGRAKRPAGA
jgi:hypothetical protein